MASKSEYLKKRKVKTLSDMLNRKFDPGKGNPKTVNPNKKKSVVPRETDYFSEAVQKFAYKLGLTDQPSAQAVREKAYSTKTAAEEVAEIKRRLKDPNDLRSAYGDIYKSYIKGPTGVYPRPKVKPKENILRSAKAVDKPTGTKVVNTVRPEFPGSYPKKVETAVTAGPGRMGSQTVTGRKKAEIGTNAAPPGGPPSGTSIPKPTATAGTGTSTGAAEKMTNFERLKARQYEREGYGGRVMTRKKATEQVMKERQYKSPLAGLFKRKGK